MRRVRLLPFFALAVATATARAQDSTSLRDTLAYTTAIVTIRGKPFANAQALGRVEAAAPIRLYTCSAGWCTVATGRLTGHARQDYISPQSPPPSQRPAPGSINSRAT